MPTVQHPAFSEITHDISDDQLAEHLAAGWVEQTPSHEDAPVKPSPKTPHRQR